MRIWRVTGSLLGILVIGAISFHVAIRFSRASDEVRVLTEEHDEVAQIASDRPPAAAAESGSKQSATRPQALEQSNPAYEEPQLTVSPAQASVGRLVFVFAGDQARRAVPAIIFNHRGDTLVVTSRTASIVPSNLPPAIDRLVFEIGTESYPAEFVESDSATLYFGLVRKPLATLTLSDILLPGALEELTVGDELAWMETARLSHSVRPERVKVLRKDQPLSFDRKAFSVRMTGLAEVSGQLPDGTPVFKDGKLVGVAVLNPDTGPQRTSLITPAAAMWQACLPFVSQIDMQRFMAMREIVKMGPPATAQNTNRSIVTAVKVQHGNIAEVAEQLLSLLRSNQKGPTAVKVIALANEGMIVLEGPANQVQATQNVLRELDVPRLQKPDVLQIPSPALIPPTPTRPVVVSPPVAAPIALPQLGRLTVAGSMPWSKSLIAPEDVPFEQETRLLVGKIRAASESERAPLIAQLTELTTRHFKVRQERRLQEIDQLARRLEELRRQHERRNELQSDIVGRRVRELTSDPTLLDWDSPAPIPQPVTGSADQISDPFGEASPIPKLTK